jgi:hypothetical protein
MAEPADNAPLMKRPAVTSRRVGGGVYVSQGDRGFLIKEPRLETVIPRLLALLDGTRPAAAVRAALPEKLQGVFDLLWNGLAANAMLTRAPVAALPPDTPVPVLRTLQNAITDWEPCLAAWRARPITLWIDFDLLPLVARPLIEQGVRQIRIVDHDGRAGAALAHAGIAGSVALCPPDAIAMAEEERLLALISPQMLPRVLALGPARTIIGLAVPAGVAIAEPGGTSAADMLAGCGLEIADDQPLPPRHCLCVAAAMLAFEVLGSVIAEFSGDAAAVAQRRHDVRVVHLDGTVISHDRRVAAISGRTISAVADHRAAGAPAALVAPADAWHHPDIGPLLEIAEDAPAFPLPHVARLVRWVDADGAPAQAQVTAWGVDPAEASRRCLVQAFEILCGGLTRRAAAAPSAAEAEARLQLQHAAAALDGPAAPVDLDADWSADVKMLARLARLYWGETPAATLAGRDAIWVARVGHGDDASAGIGHDADAALRSALGEWISARQLAQPTSRQQRQPWRALRSAMRPQAVPGQQGKVRFHSFDAGPTPLVIAVADPD